jgi:hypothetical protein
MKLLLVAGAFLFFGVLRLRSILWLTYDMWGMYLGYLGGYLGSRVLSGLIDFTQLGYITGRPWLGDWHDLSAGSIVPFDSFTNIWYMLSALEIVIGVIGVFAVYSTLMIRRSYLAKVGSITLIIAGIIDVASRYPIVESIVGGLDLFVLFRPDVKEVYALKEGSTTLFGSRSREEEVTFKADLAAPKEKSKTGRKCPK